MYAVIFELEPKQGQLDAYLDQAEQLKPLVEGIDGFISIERFQSLAEPNRYLSFSVWRDEKAIAQWRNNMQHQKSQELGRASIFACYRLRVMSVVRDYSG